MLALPVFMHHVSGKHRVGLWAHMKLFLRHTKNLGSRFQSSFRIMEKKKLGIRIKKVLAQTSHCSKLPNPELQKGR